jgi:hypothetical protein
MEDQKFWIHPDGWIYTGDQIEGAREATETEIAQHLAKLEVE